MPQEGNKLKMKAMEKQAKAKRDAEESGVAQCGATPRLAKAKAAPPSQAYAAHAEASAADASDMDDDSLGDFDDSVVDATRSILKHFMEEARAELRAYMEGSMPGYLDKSVERMVAPGERLQDMEQQHNTLAALCSKMSSDIVETKGGITRVDKMMGDSGKQDDERFDAIADAIAALWAPSAGAIGASSSRGSPPPFGAVRLEELSSRYTCRLCRYTRTYAVRRW